MSHMYTELNIIYNHVCCICVVFEFLFANAKEKKNYSGIWAFESLQSIFVAASSYTL